MRSSLEALSLGVRLETGTPVMPETTFAMSSSSTVTMFLSSWLTPLSLQAVPSCYQGFPGRRAGLLKLLSTSCLRFLKVRTRRRRLLGQSRRLILWIRARKASPLSRTSIALSGKNDPGCSVARKRNSSLIAASVCSERGGSLVAVLEDHG